MTRFHHALVVGGTGMLAAATVGLAAMSDRTTAIARRERGLRTVAGEAAEHGADVRPLAFDYRDDELLASALKDAVVDGGPIDVALCWIHSVAPAAPVTVASALGTPDHRARYFHVLPHDAVMSATRAADRRERITAAGNLSYHEIVLGSVREGPQSRWLTHAEISDGALEAIAAGHDRFFIGDVSGPGW